jgi:hypothetical protein
MTLGDGSVVWTNLAVREQSSVLTLVLNYGGDSRSSGGPEVPFRSGPEVDIERGANVSFPSQWSVPGRTGWTGRINAGEVESAVEVRRLDHTSERWENLWFSREALIPWFMWGSNCILNFGPGGFVLHPASYVRQEGERIGSSWLEASCSLEFNPPLTSKSQFIEQYFRV